MNGYVIYYLTTLIVSWIIFYDGKNNFDSIIKALSLFGVCWIVVPIVLFLNIKESINRWLVKHN